MTATITYGHGYLTDFADNDGWVDSPGGSTATDSIVEGDFLKIHVTAIGGGNAWSVIKTLSVPLSTDIYKKIRWRYKTSSSSIKAKIVVEYTAGSTVVLDETSSTTLTVGEYTLPAGRTVEKIGLYANAATGDVYYDYILICEGDFPIPAGQPVTEDWELPNRISEIDIPSKLGDETQNLGSKNAVWKLSFDLTIGTWTRDSSDKLIAQAFVQIWHNSGVEPWQWYNSELGQCKVTLHNLLFTRHGDQWLMTCELHEKRVSSAGCSLETYKTRYHLELI
jgi:hypothetical protein